MHQVGDLQAIPYRSPLGAVTRGTWDCGEAPACTPGASVNATRAAKASTHRTSRPLMWFCMKPLLVNSAVGGTVQHCMRYTKESSHDRDGARRSARRTTEDSESVRSSDRPHARARGDGRL